MATQVGGDRFVEAATLDGFSITLPTIPTVTDTNGDLGDDAGATYSLVGVVGPPGAPTGYVLRRAS